MGLTTLHPSRWAAPALALGCAALAGCLGGDELPQLATAAPASLSGTCEALAAKLSTLPDTSVTATSTVAAGTLTVAGQPVPEHCLVSGKMAQRTSTVDGNAYAIGFEMRLPKDWSGRYLYQGNGGTDGVVSQASGGFSGGGPLQNALQQGFAVISSDAGHSAAQNPLFGLDPQARLDYGYQAVGTPGRAIQEAAKRRGRVSLGGQQVDVNAEVVSIGGLSAHADQGELTRWLRAIPDVRAVALHHGEPHAQDALASHLEGALSASR